MDYASLPDAVRSPRKRDTTLHSLLVREKQEVGCGARGTGPKHPTRPNPGTGGVRFPLSRSLRADVGILAGASRLAVLPEGE
jgi:hypothetical protein